ncbi:hypothetical protein [Paenibacillus rigui]|uniref:DUF4879 domain-containing protein n=1 Tax=Paenibacillus rigui TaxID=554312 RepID=A0A229UWS0_9BACL|nr:hypothetical protein [Paenibacillus rigui]OXM87711.1 hypothetical protein CF651_00900 [Paenibacillus rigui]
MKMRKWTTVLLLALSLILVALPVHAAGYKYFELDSRYDKDYYLTNLIPGSHAQVSVANGGFYHPYESNVNYILYDGMMNVLASGSLIPYYDYINDIRSGESGFGGEFNTTTGGFQLYVECDSAAPCYAENWLDVTD